MGNEIDKSFHVSMMNENFQFWRYHKDGPILNMSD